MAVFSYYMFDSTARLVRAEAAEHADIVDALEPMRALLDELETIEMVQLWRDENFIAHVKRSDGRLILNTKVNPPPAHPLRGQQPPTVKAS